MKPFIKYKDRRKTQYDRGFLGIKKLSEKTNLSPTTLGQMIIEEKRPEIEKYIKGAGLTPSANPVKLAVQATVIHQDKIKKKMALTNTPYDEAESLVFRDEEVSEYTGESENFAPIILSLLGTVAKPAIEGLNASRTKNGKKPILSGPFWQNLKEKTKGLSLTGEGDSINLGLSGIKQRETEIGAGLDAAAEAIKKEEKKKWLKKNLIWIILGAVLVIVGIVFLVKKRK
jgi:hypothetical protein